jgi:hypothetical protein
MSSTHQPPPTDVIGRMLVRVTNEFKTTIDTPVWSLDDKALDARMADALAVRAVVDELVARLAGEMDDRGHAKRLGSSSTRAHLVGTHRLSAGEALRVIKAANQLHGSSTLTEPVRRAQACGEVSQEQATVIATAINQISAEHPVEAVEGAQADLIRYAGELPFADLQRLANHVLEVVDPDRADELIEAKLRADEKRALASCELRLRIKPDGSSDGWFKNLPALQTAMFKKAIDAYGTPRRDHLHAANQGTANAEIEPLDRKLDTSPDELPYPNRIGRAFCELLEHLPTDGLPSRGTANATVVVTIDETKLRDGLGEATLDTGTSLSASETRRLACSARILPIVLSGESKVLDLGMSERFFDRYQRLALAHRDRGCVFPRCERPPAWCEAHHCRPWSHAGPTDLDNGVLLCPFHHHLVHQGDWQIHLAPEGIPEAIPPPWVDPAQRPIRHHRFKPKIE